MANAPMTDLAGFVGEHLEYEAQMFLTARDKLFHNTILRHQQLRCRLQVEEYEGKRHSRIWTGVRRWRASRCGSMRDNPPPVVQEGKKVKKGQVVGRVDEGKLGVSIHANIDGKVRTVTPEYVEIVA